MSFAFMPLYTGDYLRDTQHLSCSEHGIFIKLLMHCWDQKGPAPLDERKLCGIVNARSSDEIEAMRRVLAEFFIVMEDGWYNRRMQREVERSEALSGKRSAAGRAGYEAKVKQVSGNCQASATTPTPTPTPIPAVSQKTQKAFNSTVEPQAASTAVGEPPKLNGKSHGENLSTDVVEVFEFWKTVRGHPSAKLGDSQSKRYRVIRARLADGYTVAQLKQAVEGVQNSPHHRGENDRSTVYDDIELICRDQKHVDMFIAFAAREPLPQVRPIGGTTSAWAEFRKAIRDNRAPDDVVIAHTIRALGGLDRLGEMSSREIEFKRQDFDRLYQQASNHQ